jgi:hypothetical protein
MMLIKKGICRRVYRKPKPQTKQYLSESTLWYLSWKFRPTNL